MLQPNSAADGGNSASAAGPATSMRPLGLCGHRRCARSASRPPMGADTKRPAPSAQLGGKVGVRGGG